MLVNNRVLFFVKYSQSISKHLFGFYSLRAFPPPCCFSHRSIGNRVQLHNKVSQQLQADTLSCPDYIATVIKE